MGLLVNGKWETTAPLVSSDKQGNFVRKESAFRSVISKDSEFKPEPGRYHCYLSYACPWASRVLIFIVLKDLENVISYSFVEPLMLENGWEFGETQETRDPLFHANYLYQIYQKADPQYSGRVTVPVLWDKKTNTIVNNESSEIIRMLNSEFNALTENKDDFYPENKRDEINTINQFIYDNINNGVYKCGFAETQDAYDDACKALFAALDTIEERLSNETYLLGNQITEADWRLFTTLIRFDCVYYVHFKCNVRLIDEYPHLRKYLRALYHIPKIEETVNFDHIKKHYYGSHKFLNPNGIIPLGPFIDYDKP